MKTAATLSVALALAGCAAGPNNTGGLGGADYSRSQSRSVQRVEVGTVEAVRSVVIDAGGGAGRVVAPIVGAAAGGALGSTIGKGKGKTVATTLGALLGGAAGSAVQQAGEIVRGLEIIVQMPGKTVGITQADEGVTFNPGDRVRVLSGSGATRVVPM
jgi:outer membrane lipoprotein SlyB